MKHDSKDQQVSSSEVPLYDAVEHNVLTRNISGIRMENTSNSKPSSPNVVDYKKKARTVFCGR